MKIQIENMRNETSGESLLKKSSDSSYSDFGNAFQTQMNHIIEESNWKYEFGMQTGLFANAVDNSNLQPSVSNSTEKSKPVRVQNSVHETRDAADRRRDKDIHSSDRNYRRNSSTASSTITASNYDADKRSSVEASTQRDNSDRTASSKDSKTSSDVQLNRRKHESPARANEQKSDASKQMNTKGADSQSTTEATQKASDKSSSTATGSTSEQQNLGGVDAPQRSVETNIQGSPDAKATPDMSTLLPGIIAAEGSVNPSLPETGESLGIEIVGYLTAKEGSNPSLSVTVESSSKEAIRDLTVKGVVDSSLPSIVKSSGKETVEDLKSYQAEAAKAESSLVESAAATAASLPISHAAEFKAAESGGAAQKTVNAAAVSRKSRQIAFVATSESTGTVSLSNGEAISEVQIHAESNGTSKSMNEARDSQTFTDVLKQNQGEITVSFKASEDSSDFKLVQNPAVDILGIQTSSPNEMLLRAALQNQQESVLPDANIKTQKTEYKLDNALLSGSNFAKVSLTGNAVGNMTHQVSAAQPKEFVLQVAERIQVLIREGKGQIRVQLRPENLGQLEIRAETTTSGVAAKITTGSRDVSNLLEANMHLLQQALQDQGLKVDRINIIIQNGFDASSSSGHNAQSGGAGSENNEQSAQLFSKNNIAQSEHQVEEAASDLASRTAFNPNIRFHRIA